MLRPEREFTNLPAGRAAQRRLRPDHGPPALLRRLPAVAVGGAVPIRRRDPGRDRRQGAQRGPLPLPPFEHVGDPARRRHRREPPPDAGRASMRCGASPRVVRRSMPSTRSWSTRGSASTPPLVRRRLATPGRCRARRSHAPSVRTTRTNGSAAAPASTPSTSATCSRRAAMDAAHLSRSGVVIVAATTTAEIARPRRARAGGRSGDSGADDRRHRDSPRGCEFEERHRGRHDHADLFGVPGDGPHQGRGRLRRSNGAGYDRVRGPHRVLAGVDHRLDDAGGEARSSASTGSRRPSPTAAGARRRCCARAAPPRRPTSSASSGRPPARLCWSATPAGSRSTTSRRSDGGCPRLPSVAGHATCSPRPTTRCRSRSTCRTTWPPSTATCPAST